MIYSLSNLSKTYQIALAGLVVALVLGGAFAVGMSIYWDLVSPDEPAPGAVAGIDIQQNSTHLKAVVVSMDRADKVYINDSSGNNVATLTNISEVATFEHDGPGSEYVVFAVYEGEQYYNKGYTVQSEST